VSFELSGISKGFSSANEGTVPVLEKLSVTFGDGELITLFGPNGCGKTTILNILAGITAPDSGAMLTNSGGPLSIGYVYQNYSDTLLPWRTVRSNIAFPLEVRHWAVRDLDAAVEDILHRLHLREHADKYVYQLSGGLRQIVAIARALVYRPKLFLLDEPFSALDYSISRKLWLQFRETWAKLGVTTVFVSHNVDEAVFLGDKVCVLSSRPASLIETVVVPFGRERSLNLLSSVPFFEIRTRVLNAFERGREGRT